MVGGFQFARWLVSGIWAVMEAAVGERSAQPLVEEEVAVREVLQALLAEHHVKTNE